MSQSCLLSRQSFYAIFSSLCRDKIEKCRDKVLLPFALINVTTELSFVAKKFCLMISFMSQHSILYLQHFLVNLSHSMLRQSCEMLRQSSFLACVQLDLCCDIAILVAT